ETETSTTQIQTLTAKPPRTTTPGSAITKYIAVIFVRLIRLDSTTRLIQAATTTTAAITTQTTTEIGTAATVAGIATRTATGIPIIAAAGTGIAMEPMVAQTIFARRL